MPKATKGKRKKTLVVGRSPIPKPELPPQTRRQPKKDIYCKKCDTLMVLMFSDDKCVKRCSVTIIPFKEGEEHANVYLCEGCQHAFMEHLFKGLSVEEKQSSVSAFLREEEEANVQAPAE